MVDLANGRALLQGCSDAFSAVKTMLIIKDGPDFYANKTVGTLL